MRNMKAINNRTELLSLINQNFNYPITKGFQIVEVNIPSDNKSWVVVLAENIKFEGSRVNAKSSNSAGACLRKLARLPRGPQACNRAAHRGTTAATAYPWSAHVWRNRRTYRLWACSASAPHTRRGGCGIDAAAPLGGHRRPTAYCRRDSAWAGTDLAVHRCLSA